MERALIIAGVGQLLLAAASLAIPRALGWREELAKLRPLTRSVFWTYAAYIWSFNVAFGLVSVLAPRCLLDGTSLARAVAGFISLYWGARAVLQITLFRKSAPTGPLYRIADFTLLALFVFLTAVYALAGLGAALP